MRSSTSIIIAPIFSPAGLSPGSVVALRFHQRAEELFLGHVVLHRAVNLARHQKRHLVFFGFVDFDLGLMRFDHALAQDLGRLGFLGDFAQGDDGVLVVVAVDRDRRTG
jgi:hypothetical protein